MSKKKKNIFGLFFGTIFRILSFIILSIVFLFLMIFVRPFIRCKTKGKENINKDDEARIFISNHYEVYGPMIAFLRFPYRFRPWVMDKMTNRETIEEQMSVGVYNNFPKVPKWIKWIVIKLAKNVLLFIMKIIRAIPVSRENARANIKTMQITSDLLSKGTNIFIWPEQYFLDSGVNYFMTGFEHIAKYHYQKTGKKVTFYPVFTSKINKTFYIEKPITFNPENDTNEEKNRVISYLHDTMVECYERVEADDIKKRKTAQTNTEK